MAEKTPEAARIDADSRHAEVLKEIVRHHIQTGEPIGSGTVSRGGRLGLSAATIRHVMAELEERGLLSQPHKSAGRLPTDKAYRIYVDQMIRRPRMAANQAQAIERALSEIRGEVEELLGEASRQLSHFSHQVGVVLAPDLQRLIVDQLEFVRLDSRRVMAILVARSGVVHNRVLHVDEPPEPRDLERIGSLLSRELGGRTLPEMRAWLQQRLREERATYDRMLAQSLELGSKAVALDETESDVFVDGTSNLLNLPEFNDLDVVRAMFRTLEDKRTLIESAEPGCSKSRASRSSSVRRTRCRIWRGVRSSPRPTGRASASWARSGSWGPTRMPYGRAMALVEHLPAVLSDLLTRSGDD